MFDNFTIQAATQKDFVRLQELLRQQLEEEKDLCKTPHLLTHFETSDETIIKLLSYWFSENTVTIFAIKNSSDLILGFVTCHLKPDFFNNQEVSSGEVVAIYVDPTYRGEKLGTRLLERAELWFTEKQVHAVNVSWLVDNEASRALYARFGFEAIHTTGRKLLKY